MAVRVWYHSRGRELDVREWRENVACVRVGESDARVTVREGRENE